MLALKTALLMFTGITTLYAQDTLWVKKRDGRPYLACYPKAGEDLFLLAKKFSVPPAVLADVNNLTYQSGLPEHTAIWIPVDNYNFIRVEGIIKSRPLFYKVTVNDQLSDLSRMVNVSQAAIQRWNGLSGQELKPDQAIQVGWISFDAAQVPFAKPQPVAAPAKPVAKDSLPYKDPVKPLAAADTTSEELAFESTYEEQVNGTPSSSETGAAVFYSLRFKAPAGVYYAMHNTAEKGTIIKVTNPANGNFVYVKVIGTIPAISDYNNAVIAISSNAAKTLLAKEKRMFCKIEYR